MKMTKTKKRNLKKLKDAVRVLHYFGFISEFEKDSFLMRFEKFKKP